MDPLLVTIIVTLVTRLTPVFTTALEEALQLLFNNIPSQAKIQRDFVSGCITITRDINDNPAVRFEDKSRYAADACRAYARRLGVELLEDDRTFAVLGLSVIPEPSPEV